MGVLNVTPDSFSDGCDFLDPAVAVAHATAMLDEGARIIDVGGESTRPGSDPVRPEEEALRVDPRMAALVADARCPVVLMHMLGEPKTMQHDPRYGDVVSQVHDFLAAR